MEKTETAQAISYYQKAVNYEPNPEFTPEYLLKLATAQEVSGDEAGAIKSYQRVIEEFPEFTEIGKARKYLAKLTGKDIPS
jgi:TolA-binding protein